MVISWVYQHMYPAIWQSNCHTAVLWQDTMFTQSMTYLQVTQDVLELVVTSGSLLSKIALKNS